MPATRALALYGFSRSGQASLRRLRASLPFPRLCRKAVGGGGGAWRKADCREKRRPRRSRKETRGAGWAIKWRRRLGVPGAAPATGRREEEEWEPLPPPAESDLRFSAPVPG